MNKKLLFAILGFYVLTIGAVYALDVPQNSANKSDESLSVKSDEQQNKKSGTSSPTEEQSKTSGFLDYIDMNNWQYNEQDKVYYQLGITYCKTPEDPAYEKLALFVPEEYMSCKINMLTDRRMCSINQTGMVQFYKSTNAPIIIKIDAPGYASIPALTEYKDFTDYTKEGMIYLHVGARGREHGAPAGVTDFKAAIRYIRRNIGVIPGSANRIIVRGMGNGGGLAVILGVSGDSALYTPYLQQIGAVEGGRSDVVNAIAVWSPIMNLDTANEAYEWSFGQTRKDMTKEQQSLSDAMAKAYAQYINHAGFMIGRNGALTLQQSDEGVYQFGTYYDYIRSLVGEAFTKFIRTIHFPYVTHAYEEKEMYQKKAGRSFRGVDLAAEDDEMRTAVYPTFEPAGSYLTLDRYFVHLNEGKEWLTYSIRQKQVEITDMAVFARLMKPATKPIGAFDSLHRTQAENILFGIGDGKGLHFDRYTAKIMENTPYEKEFKADFKVQDKLGRTVSQRVDMYNPLYFIMPSYQGFRTAKATPLWRIRSGLWQSDTPLTTEVNFFLALDNFLRDYTGFHQIDFQMIWEAKHEEAELKGSSTDNFIEWIKKLTEPT